MSVPVPESNLSHPRSPGSTQRLTRHDSRARLSLFSLSSRMSPMSQTALDRRRTALPDAEPWTGRRDEPIRDEAAAFRVRLVDDAEPAGSLGAKRVLDATLAAIGLVLSAPIWIALAAAIKLEDGGPIFFTQTRVGKHGEPFRAIKFRSMVDGNHDAVKGHPDGDLVTSLGAFMRKCALDELPQLWNILRGDMSLVGPRALPPAESARENGGRPVKLSRIPGYTYRHKVRPGLTGIAQVRAPRDIPYRCKFRYDCFYVRKRSLLLDLRLIARSLWVSFAGKWREVGKSRETT